MLGTLPTYHLPLAPADVPAQPSRAVVTDDRPTWAVRMGLPSRSSLVYLRDLTTAALAALVIVYLAAVALQDRGALVRALRKRAGV